jgi:hypothetical protein
MTFLDWGKTPSLDLKVPVIEAHVVLSCPNAHMAYLLKKSIHFSTRTLELIR